MLFPGTITDNILRYNENWGIVNNTAGPPQGCLHPLYVRRIVYSIGNPIGTLPQCCLHPRAIPSDIYC